VLLGICGGWRPEHEIGADHAAYGIIAPEAQSMLRDREDDHATQVVVVSTTLLMALAGVRPTQPTSVNVSQGEGRPVEHDEAEPDADRDRMATSRQP